METLYSLRTIETKNFRVEFAAHAEHINPADTIAWDDPKAEAEYCRKIDTGEYPWYCLGVHVYFRGHRIGSSYLGGVDTEDLRSIGVRYIASEAIKEARKELEAMAEGAALLSV